MNPHRVEHEIKLRNKQYTFVFTDKKLFALIGGVGSGKTFAGSVFSWLRANNFPKARGFIGANTIKQLNNSTLPPYFEFLDKIGTPYVYNRRPHPTWGRSHFKKHDGIISMRTQSGEMQQTMTYTLENPEAYKGIQIGWFWIDETADTDPAAIKILYERFRGFDKIYPGMKYKGRFTTTPNGFDYMYDILENPKKKLPDSGYVRVHSCENAENLPPNFVSDLEARLGIQLARQQLAGEFISLTAGRVFTFERRRHAAIKCEYNPSLPLIWSMDFNVAPMAGVVMQTDKDKVWVLGEICVPDNAQTREAVAEFSRIWKGKDLMDGGRSRRAVVAWGDRAGLHRDTRGNESDIDIMLNTLRAHFHTVKDGQDYGQRFVIDGVNAVNALFDHDRLFIDPSCELLIQDMEQMNWKPGTKEIEKAKNKALTHFGDALRYPIAQMFELAHKTHSNKAFGGSGFY